MMLVMVIITGASLATGKDVILDINGRERHIVTYAVTVSEFLEKEKIELKEKDLVEPSLPTKLLDGTRITITSPKSYTIYDAKKTSIKMAKGNTPREILNYLGIEISPLDRVEPGLDEVIDKKEIKITRITKETKEVNEVVPFDVLENINKELEEGKNNVVTAGVDGLRRDTIETTYENGTPMSSVVLKSELVNEPVAEVREIGTKKVETFESEKIGDISDIKGDVAAVYTLEATAYDPTAGSKTALGTRARVGAVAVDPKVIPLGSKLYIESMDGWPSYGYAVAEDTGGAIKGKRIDLFFNSNAEANRFGRRNVKVYVLK